MYINIMVLPLSLLAIGLLAVAATADSAAQPNHDSEWLEQVYGDTGGREKRQIAEGGKHWATMIVSS